MYQLNNKNVSVYIFCISVFIQFDFGQRRVSLKSYFIHGISNPYLTSFNISGSNDAHYWSLITKEEKLGEDLHSKKKSFYLNHYTNFFRFIKLQFIESKFESGTSISTTLFGMIEFDIFGILSPKSYFPFFTCLPKTKHLILLPLCYIVFVS